MNSPSNLRTRILLVGVGGQGVLTAAALLGHAAGCADLPATVGQLHGMSQRGGSVEATVIVGSSRTAYIGTGEADIVIGFEPLETWRSLPRMGPHTQVVMNTGAIRPPSLSARGQSYPPLAEIAAAVRAACGRLLEFDGAAVVREIGMARALNMGLLGAASGLAEWPVDAAALDQALEEWAPPRALSANRRALALGRTAIQSFAGGTR